MTTSHRMHRPLLVLAIAAGMTVGACTSAGAPAASDPPPSHRTPAASDPGGGGTGGDPGTGIGIDLPINQLPIDPGTGQPILVVPRPGQANIRAISPIALQASVDGRRVLVKLTWYSGVEPCNVLDSIEISRSGTDIAITPFEGTGNANAMCIEIAVLKATIVDLGELEPGTYRIGSPGSTASPLEITVA
ncbi:MAG TPA: hypothetical protein VM427_01185 [Patescibacteria group bacterium]|nr:hypothetical protein [Patescibacteria group bacterium]